MKTPPQAAKHPEVLQIHGDDRIDPYFWLRDAENPKTIAYLEAENAYTQAMLAHTEPLQAQLYQEMLGRIQETDLSVPYQKGEFFYYSRTEKGQSYAIFCRKRGSLTAPEEVLLDHNKLAEGKEYCELGVLQVSPDHKTLAYAIDTDGSERYTLYFLNLETFEQYPEEIPDVYYGLAWGNDSQTVFYTQVDEAHRPYRLWRHHLGQSAKTDHLVYEEADEAFYLSLGKSRSESYIFLNLGSKVTSEIWYLDANQPTESFQIIQPRSPGVEYQVAHHSDSFYLLTNQDALNFKLMKAPIADLSQWELVIPHRSEVFLEGVSAFADHLVIYERQRGLPMVRIRQLSTGAEHYITFPEPTYEVGEGNNPEFHTQVLRFSYTSLVTPSSVYDYDMVTQVRELKKETPVLGGYDRTQYRSDRMLATAADGTEVPISLVCRVDCDRSKPHPLFLTGYGSYGASYPVYFSSNRLSLLDRGVVMAIAHVRGGAEMGRGGYEAGKFLHKKNTFTDFIACAEHLIAKGWTTPAQLAISGGSAGGLLMGAVINLRPDLFHAVVADVPFVDVVTTILDPSLPLSVMEWEEWGNPNDPNYYTYMKSYSPYDNVVAQNYPAMLVTAGLNDARVKFWEPAKWVAKLRDLKTDHNLLLLKTNMGAGHGGASGRYDRLREIALEYAFLLDQWGLGQTAPASN